MLSTVFILFLFFFTWLRMTAQCIVLLRSAQAVHLAADAVWWSQCVRLASVLMNKGDISAWEFRSCEVKKKKCHSASALWSSLLEYYVFCKRQATRCLRAYTAYPVRSTSPCVSPPQRGKKKKCLQVHIRDATPDECLHFFAGHELYYMVTVFWTQVFTLSCTFYT